MVPNQVSKPIQCSLCGGQKQAGSNTCLSCYKEKYVPEAAALALKGGAVPSKEEWAKEKISAKIPEFEKDVAQKKAVLEDCTAKKNKQYGELDQKTNREGLDPEVAKAVEQMLEERSKSIWAEVGGKRALVIWQTAEDRLAEAKLVLSRLEPSFSGEEKLHNTTSLDEETVAMTVATAPLSNDNGKGARRKRINDKP